ncbi:MAG: hypothetical protein DRI86_06360 [Bacteroidetes bacterium]|nr:MAG: hypothetical protein DRI86_06360 [Bacteroidota bacterium]
MHIQAYLQEVNSSLFKESHKISFTDLCRAMHIVKGPDEFLFPVNVGLLFFSKQPEKFFSRAWIELVWYKTVNGHTFNEYYFKGPLQTQLREVFAFLKTNILAEKTIKYPDRAKADRFYNFPFEALEEAISNAVYHKSYEIGSPIEIQVWPDKITILSYPGPMPPITSKVISINRRIYARMYRNRRIGDFLKELGLTEGRGGGFPAIYDALEANGSPNPSFETDDESYFLTTLFAHPDYLDDALEDYQVSNQVSNQDNNLIFSSIKEIEDYCTNASNQVSNQADDKVKQSIIDVIVPV